MISKKRGDEDVAHAGKGKLGKEVHKDYVEQKKAVNAAHAFRSLSFIQTRDSGMEASLQARKFWNDYRPTEKLLQDRSKCSDR